MKNIAVQFCKIEMKMQLARCQLVLTDPVESCSPEDLHKFLNIYFIKVAIVDFIEARLRDLLHNCNLAQTVFVLSPCRSQVTSTGFHCP
jgi:hypothetical protein